tara:strand:+ start:101 stop:406 length:306 start_codon:yes stop_codon:yes gene_type:complete
MSNLEETEDKINFIIFLFKNYQKNLTLFEQITLLTLWEESCVLREEYEMAAVLKKEMEKIQQNPNKTPHKNTHISDITKKTKTPFYVRFFKWVKGWFFREV